ncbi:zinc-dependent metalloprotease family protein [uncultured Pontibacter sp.]|uniref:zinc-dependent metalloprotease family protein n=1 Tax=uncultured Pontibacter sp. TaxID=453356 RepID=UPI00260561F0|nr:zinc-dependent metalloprotease family protein [uncultured Pontibacter sp.]
MTKRLYLIIIASLLIFLSISYGLHSLGYVNIHYTKNDNLFFEGKIALVPFGEIRNSEVQYVKAQIEKFYGFEVDVLNRAKMPANAFYKPRSRYKASKVLDHLIATKSVEYDKVIALSNDDISAKVKGYKDWGVIGLAYLGNSACIVSTYRLGKQKVSSDRFKSRLAKASLHELGHTLGLPHCDRTDYCFMNDAKGKVSTIDRANLTLCDYCQKQILIYQL